MKVQKKMDDEDEEFPLENNDQDKIFFKTLL